MEKEEGELGRKGGSEGQWVCEGEVWQVVEEKPPPEGWVESQVGTTSFTFTFLKFTSIFPRF